MAYVKDRGRKKERQVLFSPFFCEEQKKFLAKQNNTGRLRNLIGGCLVPGYA